MQDWRQYAARDEVKPALQAPGRIVLQSAKTPLAEGHTTILLLTLRANNIQVRAVWKVTNALNAFDIDNGKLSLMADPNETAIFVATVYLIDNFQLLNTAYQNLTASAVITVSVKATAMVEGLSVAQPPRLEVKVGVAEEVYVFEASGGITPHTYTLLHNPDADAFYFTQGALSVNVSATIGEYRFTVAVVDAATMAVTVTATVEVAAAALAVAQPPRLEVTAGMAEEVYVFAASGGIMPHTYTLLHNPDDDAFYFTQGALSVNISATIGEYRFTVAVVDAATMAVTVTATVEVAAAALAVAQPPRLEVTAGAAEEVYVFVVSGGIMPHTYTLLHNPNPNAFYFTNGTLSVNISATIGVYRFTVAVADALSRAVTVTATVSVAMVPDLSVAIPPRLEVTAGAAEEVYVFVASGGIMPHTYTLLHNPDDNAFYFTQGTLSVNISATIGEYRFTVAVADALIRAVTVTATVSVAMVPDLSVAIPPRLEVTAGAAEEVYVFVVSGGIMPHTYTLLHNPDDKAFYFTNGTLSVNISATIGEYHFTVAVADAASMTVTVTATVEVVAAPLTVAQPPRLEVTAGVAGEVYVFEASGGVMPHTYTLLHNPDDKAFYFTNGTLSVNISATIDEYRFTVAVADAASMTVTVTATVEVVAAPLTVAQPPRLEVTAGVAGEVYVFEASGGVMPHTYTLLHNPDDKAFYFTNGTLSVNISATIDEYRFTVAVADAASMTVTVTATVEVVAAPLTVAQPPRLEVTAGVAGEVYVFAASGGIMPHTYTLLHNPDDDAFYFTQGTLSVNISATIGEYRFTVAVVDAASMAVTVTATVEVAASPLTVAQPPRLEVTAGVAGEVYVFEASGGVMPHTYTLLHNPDDKAFYFTNGTLSVNISATIDEYRFTVAVADAASMTVTVTATVEVVAAPLTVAQPPRLEVTAGVAGEVYVFEASGGVMPHTYTLLHNPDDKAFYFTNGTLSVNISATIDEYRFTVAVADAASMTVTVTATVEVVAAPLTVAQPPRLEVTAGVAGEVYVFEASGGIMPHTYTLLHNPDDDTFYFNHGTLSVNISVTSGEYRFTVAVTDAENMTVTVTATVEVAALPLAFGAEVPPLAVSVGVSVNLYTFAAIGGIGDKRYTIVAGNEGGFVLAADSGVLSLLPEAAERVYTLSVEASDRASPPSRITAAATVRVGNKQIFVLGGFNGSNRLNDMWSSADGQNWMQETANAEWTRRSEHQALSHNGQLYVLGGDDGSNRLNDVWSSADGKNWGQETANAKWTGRDDHQAVSHNGRLYVLGGYDGSNRLNDVWSSADGKNWMLETANAKWTGRDDHQAVSHNGRLYVLGGNDGSILNDVWSSADGKNWMLETANAEWAGRSEHQAVSHNGRLYVLGGNDGSILNDVWSSADGKNWERETDGAGWTGQSEHRALSHNGRLYVLGTGVTEFFGFFAILNDVWSSANGKDWMQETGSPEWTGRFGHQAVVFPPELILLGVGERLTITTGTAPNLHTFTAQYGVGDYSYSLNPEVSSFDVSPGGVLSADGSAAKGKYLLTVWVEDSAGNRAQTAVRVLVPYFNLAEVPRLLGFAGISKVLHTFTADGGIAGEEYMIVAGNKEYFSLDADSGVLSLLTTAWEGVYTLSVEVSDSSSPSSKATAAATVEIKGKQIFVLGGNFLNDVWFSVDDEAWMLATDGAGWVQRNGPQALSHNGRLYVLGGDDFINPYNDVWSSADGQNWGLETNDAGWLRRRQHQAVSHNGQLYVLGGDRNSILGGYGGGLLNDVWSSADGQNWGLEADDAGWTGRYEHQALSYNGRLYVLGGYGGGLLNDVWSSADGQNWVQETDGAEWTGRYEHQALSHNGRLYVLGGNDGSLLNDVWSSADGKNWVQETANAKWTGRSEHQAVSHNGRLYVLGGDDGSNLNDMWSSADGKNWSLETANAGWTRRQGHQAVVFPPELVLLGVGERLTVSAGIAEDLHTFKSQYGRGNYSYSLNPEVSGFDVSPGGVLSADGAAATGKYILTVWAEDSAGNRAQTAVRIIVPYFNLAEVPRLFGLAGFAKVLHTFTTDGGIAGEQYTMVAGNTPGYFTLDADSGVLSLLTTALAGVYTLSVEVSDSASSSHKATAAATVEINDRWIFVLGGYGNLENSSRYRNDVWSAADGKNWLRETDDAEWTRRSGHQALPHNGRLYVLGGNDRLNDVWSSADGQNWSLENDDAGWTGRSGHQAVSHNGRLYVLGGYKYSSPNHLNDVWSSVDGQNWSLENDDAGWVQRSGHQALSHNGRLYVLGGEDKDGRLNDVWSSADGQNWLLETNGTGWSGRSEHQVLSHNGRLYVLGGNDGSLLNDVWSSADGQSWLLETNGAGWSGRDEHQVLSHNGRLYVLGGDGGSLLNDVWSSADGKNWSRETDDAEWSGRESLQAVVFPPELVLFGVSERLTVSAGITADLHTFTVQYGEGDSSYSLNPAVKGFAVSPGGVLSADGTAVGGKYILTIWAEDAAGNWAQTAVRVLVPYVNLAEVPRLLGLAGISKVLHIFTTDGGIVGGQYTIVAGNTPGYFTLDADSGALSLLTTALEGVYTLSVEVSDSSSSSSKATTAATVEIQGKQIFVLGGQDNDDSLLNDVWFSVDDEAWMLATDDAEWTERYYHQAVSHNGRLYVLGGNSLNDVWSSADGKNWSLETDNAGWTGRSGHQAVSHNGRLYVLGGNSLNDVWSSADGKNWVPETDNAGWAGFQHQAVSHNGRIYVLGSYGSDVWSSADGKNWSLETDNAGWPGRQGPQAVSHNGRIYILGGFGNNNYRILNDVWSSADGKNWVQVYYNYSYSGFSFAWFGHQALSHNGRLYVLGGSGGSLLNDEWSSADGANWSREPDDAGWSGRSGYQAVVFPPELALLGVGERLTVSAGIAEDLHTFTAQYGRGDYTYSLSSTVSGFAVSPGGVLSAESNTTVGEYTLTVWVKDAAGDRAQTALRVDVVAQSTAQSHIFTGEFWATGDESVNIVIARSSTGINLAECWRGGSGDGERFTRIYSTIWFG